MGKQIEKCLRNLRGLRYYLYSKWPGDLWKVLLHGDLLILEKQLAKGEVKYNNSRFQNHLGLCFAMGTLRQVFYYSLFESGFTSLLTMVFYSLSLNLNVLLVTVLRIYVKEAGNSWKISSAVDAYLALLTLNSLFNMKP